MGVFGKPNQLTKTTLGYDGEFYLSQCQQRVEQLLARYLASSITAPESLLVAMRYAVLNGGKRLRPLLVYTTGKVLGAPLAALDHAACAVELIHAYSLVHDDLPTLDNDAWRRGQPTCHKAFGEAVALLSADALQSLAFEVLSQAAVPAKQVVKMLAILAKAAGASGMVGGQMMEFDQSPPLLDRTFLETVHSLKTGALIAACIQLARLAANSDETCARFLDQLGTAIGLAYQIQDDIKDADSVAGNYVTVLGLSSAQARLTELSQHIIGLLQSHFAQRVRPFYILLDYMFPHIGTYVPNFCSFIS